MVSGSEDGRLCLWEVNSKQLVLDRKLFEGPLLAMAVSPDTGSVAVASLEPDLNIKIFQINSN